MKPQALNLSAFRRSPPISAHLCQGSNPLWLIGWMYGDYFFLPFFLYLPRDTLKEREMDGYAGKKRLIFFWWCDRVVTSLLLLLLLPHTLLLSRRATLTAHMPKWSLKAGTVLTSQSPGAFSGFAWWRQGFFFFFFFYFLAFKLIQ